MCITLQANQPDSMLEASWIDKTVVANKLFIIPFQMFMIYTNIKIEQTLS